MRMDPANWKLGFIYVCPDDPRVVVRQRLLLGWTWNFGTPRVIPAILFAVLISAAPPFIGWWAGIQSTALLLMLLGIGIAIVILAAHRLSKDPGN